MSTQPVSSGLKVVFAIVALFLGWLFAIMIPADTPIGRNWAISLPRKTSEAAAIAYWLDGTGMRVGQPPADQVARANTSPATPDRPIVPSEGKVAATLPRKNESADNAKDKYVLFDPNTKVQSGNESSKTSPLPENSQLKKYGNNSENLAQLEPSTNSDVWELQGKSLERKLQDKQWQTEVQMPKITLPEFKNTPLPRWSDEIAKSISKTAEPSGQKSDVSKEKQIVKPKPSIELAQSDSNRDKVNVNKETDHKDITKVSQVPPKTEAKTESRGEPKAEPKEQAVVARPVDSSPVKKAEAVVADAKPKTLPEPKTEEKSNFTPFTTTVPIDKPVVLDLKPTGSIQPERRPVVTGRLTVNETPTVPTVIAKPSAEDANAFYAKSGKMESVNLIPSQYNQDNYQIRGTDYSTVVPQTVQRQPGTTTTTAKVVTGNTGTALETANSGKAAPSSAMPSISAVTTYRPDTDLTPDEVGKQKNMSPSQYERFLRNNSGKLDATGRFPAKTLLLIPE